MHYAFICDLKLFTLSFELQMCNIVTGILTYTVCSSIFEITKNEENVHDKNKIYLWYINWIYRIVIIESSSFFISWIFIIVIKNLIVAHQSHDWGLQLH